MALSDELRADFPDVTSLLIIVGNTEEAVQESKDKLLSGIDWKVIDSLRSASEMIAERADQAPDPSTSVEHWREDHVTVDAGMISYDVDPVTLLALSHVQDKGYEVGVSGVVGFIWNDDEEDPWKASSGGGLLSQVLGLSLLLDAEHAHTLSEQS